MSVSTPLRRFPPLPRFRPAACVAVASVGAVAAFSSVARAQFAYSEPPDLPPGPVGTAVGTVSEGVNTVNGTFSAVWSSMSGLTGDHDDAFQFVVPVGLEVSAIDVVVSIVTGCNACPVHAGLLVNGLGSVAITGNGTFAVPISAEGGSLPAGTYSVELSATFNAASAGNVDFFTYQFRITADRSNDACAFARPVGLGATSFNTSSATTDGPDHPALCTFFGNPGIDKDIWFTFAPAADGRLTVDTCGSTYDTELAIYQGTGCDNLTTTILACNDDSAACGDGSTQSSMQTDVAVGQAYLIRVGGFSGNSGPGTLNLGIVTTGACCNRATGGCLVLGPGDCATLGCDFVGFGTACSPESCTACPVDFNHSGVVSVQDIFDFLAAYFAGCP